ncbi:MAG: outer membrane protein assembly factor BamD [Betaproteobacteria bacterium]|nr:outer membrane protein assembly factor BamD [Betaproteobacteria bacterium]NBY13869.1 outer membrane protein assembly factor BamD [Betaproteobacteria bacterium]
MRAFSLSLALAILLGLSGCASDPASRDETLNWTAEKLYAEAQDELSSGNYAKAIALLQKLESRYPFGRFAQQAQINTAYAHWKEGEMALALAAIDRFTRLYPNHENLDYVLYLKGLINVNDRATLFSAYTGEDFAERDPRAAREAFDTFKELVTRFPESKYAPDASARLQFLINLLAQNDVHVARYYLRRGAFLAAVNRAQQVTRQYQEAPAVEEALAQMVLGYDRLGLVDLRDDARRVLALNYPKSAYLKHGYDPKVLGGLPADLRPDYRGMWSRFKFWEKLPSLGK